MKKLLTITLSVLLIAATSFASPGNEPDNKKITESFTKIFAAAKSVQWEQSATFTRAQFQLNGAYLSAYFTPDADFMGLTRNLTSDQLPLHLLTDLKKNYSQYWITELFEYATADTDNYFVTLQNSEKTIILKGNLHGFSVYKKTAK